MWDRPAAVHRGILGGVSEPASLRMALRPLSLGEDRGVDLLSSSSAGTD